MKIVFLNPLDLNQNAFKYYFNKPKYAENVHSYDGVFLFF